MNSSSGIQLIPLPIVFSRALNYRWFAMVPLLATGMFIFLFIIGSNNAVLASCLLFLFFISVPVLVIGYYSASPAKISIDRDSVAVMKMHLWGAWQKPFERPISEFDAVESIYVEALPPPQTRVTHQLIKLRSKIKPKYKFWELRPSFDDVEGDIIFSVPERSTFFSLAGYDYASVAKALALQLELPYEHRIVNPLDFKNRI